MKGRTFCQMLTTICKCKNFLPLLLLIPGVVPSFAQVTNFEESHRGSLYIGVGYDKQWYKNQNISVNQPSTNSAYKLSATAATDQGPANDAASPLHYNYTVGYILNYNQTLGIELAYDPMRYYIGDFQKVHAVGTLDGAKLDSNISFARPKSYVYGLQDGLGILSFNIVRRYGVYRKVSHKLAIDVFAKLGVGMVTPSVEYNFGNTALKNPSNNGNGLAYTGTLALRWITHRHVYLEADYKYEYMTFTNMAITDGTLTQNITGSRISLNLGYTFPVTHQNPLFSVGYPHRKEVKHPKPMYNKEEDY
jgi:hypothetical protein